MSQSETAIHVSYTKHALGDLIVATYQGELVCLDFRYRKMRAQIDRRLASQLKAEYREETDPLHQEVLEQLEAYMRRERQDFSVPIRYVGSAFQIRVWEALRQIPYGATCSYTELAEAIGSPESVRAVASANGANALAVIVPCHRVIGADGSLTGYGGGLAVKKKLLLLERDQLF